MNQHSLSKSKGVKEAPQAWKGYFGHRTKNSFCKEVIREWKERSRRGEAVDAVQRMYDRFSGFVIDAGNYDGKVDIREIVGPILFGGVFTNPENGLTFISDDIQSSKKLTRGNTSNIRVKSYECRPTPDNSVAFEPINVAVCDLQAVGEFCVNDLAATQLEQMISSQGLANIQDSMPPVLEDFILSYYINQLARDIEIMFWQGGYGTGGSLSLQYPSDQCVQGILTKALAYGSASPDGYIDVPGVTLTKANIIDEIDRMLNERAQREDFNALEPGSIYIAMNPATVNGAYMPAMRTQPGNANYDRSAPMPDAPYDFDGIPVIPTVGVPVGHMVVSYSRHPDSAGQNLILGTDLVSDFSNVEVYMAAKPSDAVGFKAQFRLGAEIANPRYFIHYHPNA